MVQSENHLERPHKTLQQLVDEKNYALAFKPFKKGADQGNSYAQYAVGWMYYKGEGVEKNLELAERYFRKAAADNDPEALFYLGKISTKKINLNSAKNWFEKSASYDFAPAIFRLGLLYDYDSFEGKNKDLAFRLFEKAAKLGHIHGLAKYSFKLRRGHCGSLGRIKGCWLFLKGILTAIWLVIRKGSKSEEYRLAMLG
jgi:TPR repeat protein